MTTTVCDLMDEVACTGDHAPHAPIPTGALVTYEDGDIEREGRVCQRCGHVTADFLFHTDPRLDA